jgi:hypothetical protein
MELICGIKDGLPGLRYRRVTPGIRSRRSHLSGFERLGNLLQGPPNAQHHGPGQPGTR